MVDDKLAGVSQRDAHTCYKFLAGMDDDERNTVTSGVEGVLSEIVKVFSDVVDEVDEKEPKLRLPSSYSFDVVRRSSKTGGKDRWTLVDINVCNAESDTLLFESFEELQSFASQETEEQREQVELRVVQEDSEARGRGRRAADYSAMPLELAELATGKMETDELLRMVQRVESQQKRAAKVTTKLEKEKVDQEQAGSPSTSCSSGDAE